MAQPQHKPKATALEWDEEAHLYAPAFGRDSTVLWISELIYVKNNTKKPKTKIYKKSGYFEQLGFLIHFSLLPAVLGCHKGKDGHRDAFDQFCHPKSITVKLKSKSICPYNHTMVWFTD